MTQKQKWRTVAVCCFPGALAVMVLGANLRSEPVCAVGCGMALLSALLFEASGA